MRINTFLTFISLALAGLLGYFIYTIAKGHDNDTIYSISSGICFMVTLIPTMGLQYKSGRIGANIRIFSIIFFIIFVICHFLLAGFGCNLSYYIIVNAIILILFLAVFYMLLGIRDL